MKKKSFILIIVILLILSVSMITLFIGKKEKNSKEVINKTNTTQEQRFLWNEFLSSNPYLSQIETISEINITATDLIKVAITSNKVETESIVTKEIEENEFLSWGDGYKKSKNNINDYIRKIFGNENIAYNFVDTYVQEDNYLLVEEDYIYYTRIEIPEKIYIAIVYEEKKGNYEVQIYEYNVTEENREVLMSMLETGNINEEIKITNKYILTGQITNNDIKISTKSSL